MEKKHNFKVIDLEKINREDKAKRGFTEDKDGFLVNQIGLSEVQMLAAIGEIEMYLDELCGDRVTLEYVFFPSIITELAAWGGQKEDELIHKLMVKSR